ncbi:HAD-IIIC family phosphatase [Streptomyces sp. NPDC051940]|uniref:HAD-IIIC family phosphatase n=1 Tax=Streptomyces sp. NPDC051940 TaxID=3155675 RepID=UPI0034434311
MGDGLDRLRALHAQGLLAKAYDEVPRLLAGETGEPAAGGAELRTAGRLLAGLDPDAVLAHHPGTPAVTVAVTGSSTAAPVLDPLTAELARHGILCRPVVGDHGAWLRDLTDPDSELRAARPDVTLCLLDAQAVFAEVPVPWRPEDVERSAARLIDRLTAIAADWPGLLVFNTLPLLRGHTHQLVDHASRAALGALWRECNARLLRLAGQSPRLVVVDLEPLLNEGGPVTDARLAVYASLRLGAEVLACYAREVAHLVRAVRGRTRKCLVLDLDNTLWDGILGEDGPQGVTASGSLRGEAFHHFQRVVKQLAAQGVLLAVSSKNDAALVHEVLADHPDLVLREQDFAVVKADWRSKDLNLREAADELGLALDALVFADDTAAERAQVRLGAPGVAVVALDGEPALHPDRLLADGWFDTLRLTEEDVARTGRYRGERRRRELRETSGSYAEFLAGLETRVALGPPRAHELARLAQLTQRTNQFNLTGLRQREDELSDRAADPRRHLLLVARTADRFGEHGLTGAVLGCLRDDVLELKNVWLSCRVLGRGIEHALLATLLATASERGLRAVEAGYVPTSRNHRARGFYAECGFADVTPAAPGTGERRFRHGLTDLPAVPDHILVDRLAWEGDRDARG